MAERPREMQRHIQIYFPLPEISVGLCHLVSLPSPLVGSLRYGIEPIRFQAGWHKGHLNWAYFR